MITPVRHTTNRTMDVSGGIDVYAGFLKVYVTEVLLD